MSRPEKDPKTIGAAMANWVSAENEEEKELSEKELKLLKGCLVKEMEKQGVRVTFRE